MSSSDSLSEVFRHPFMEKLGWALLHFVWQGVAVAIVFWLALVMMRRASANARYFDGHKQTLGQDEFAPNRFGGPGFFWQAGISTGWLIGALRRPEAKLVERIKLSEMSCLHIEVRWKPDWDTADRHFDIMICPEQGWLPRRVVIERGGEMQAEWSISDVATTASGLAYPVEFETKRPETDTTPLRRVTITSFRERTDFKLEELVIAPQLGMDIVDHQQGFAWHNDPWWEELSPWMRENLNWPQPDLQPLQDLRSYSETDLAGMNAPPIVAGEWLTEPVPLNWDRPERKVTVLHFFGGLLIEPSPKQLKALDHLQRRYRDSGLEVIGITSNDRFREQHGQSVKELNLTYPVFIDNKASEADLQSKAMGSAWGATYVAYRQRQYTGTVVIDGSGKVLLFDPGTPNLPNGMSHVESLVRDVLIKANGTADPPRLRQQLVDPARISRAAFVRVEDEWKRRASLANRNGLIRGTIRKHEEVGLVGCKAIVVVNPYYRY